MAHVIYRFVVAADCGMSLICRVFGSTCDFKSIPYSTILRADEEMRTTIDAAPLWMREEAVPLDPSFPSFVEWQRRNFMVCRRVAGLSGLTRQVSSSHKFVVLHRPYLGRAFRGEERYAKSKEVRLMSRLTSRTNGRRVCFTRTGFWAFLSVVPWLRFDTPGES